MKVEIQWIDWGTYGSQYKVRYAGGVMPDVVSIGSAGSNSQRRADSADRPLPGDLAAYLTWFRPRCRTDCTRERSTRPYRLDADAVIQQTYLRRGRAA